jgi:hypothetical protein
MEDRLIIEEDDLRDIAELETEQQLAIEALFSEFNKADRLLSLQDHVRENGVSRIAMESLSAIYPNSLSELTPAYTFTANPSQHQIEVAQENFLKAVGEAIVWVFEKILEAMKKVIEVFVAIFKWLFGIGEQAKREMNIHERVYDIIHRADEIHKDFRKTEAEFKSKVPENRQEGVAIKSALFEEYLKKTYNTQLDVDIVENASYATLDGALRTADAILKICESYSTMLFEIHRFIKEMLTTSSHGNRMYDYISDIRDMFLAESSDFTYILLPYSFSQTFNAIEGNGGLLPRDRQSFLNRDSSTPIWFMDPNNVKRDAFWKGKVTDKTGHPLARISWGVEHRVYSVGLKAKGAAHLDFSKIEKQNFEKSMKEFNTIRDKITQIGKDFDKKGSRIKQFNREVESLKLKRLKVWQSDNSYRKNTMVWPESWNGYSIGDDIGIGQFPLEIQPFKALAFPETLIGPYSSIFPTIVSSFLFMQGPFKDISAVIERNFKMHRDYAQYLNQKQKDTATMKEYL